MEAGSSAGSSGLVTERRHSTGRVIFMACVGALGGFLFGYDSAVINGANAAIQYKFDISDGTLGIVVAIALVGSAIGAWFAGQLADKFGRKRVALTAAVLFVVAGLGQGFPFGTGDFMAWRLVGGFAIGVASVAAPMYISEIAPANLRGRLTALFQFAIVIGIFATGLGNYLLLSAAGPVAGTVPEATGPLWGLEAWQWMFLLMAVPAAIYFVLTLTIPESPRWLVQAGKLDQARSVLGDVYGGDIDAKVAEIQETLKGEHRPRMRDLRGPRFGLLPIVWVAMLLSVFQQFVGINAVMYYSNLVYSSVGLDEQHAFLTSMITTGVNVVFTIVAILLIDKIGRKPLLLIGSAGMAVALATIAIVFGTAQKCTAATFGTTIDGCDVVKDIGQPLLSPSAGFIAVIALNVFVAFFAATWGPVVWVMISEMFPNRIRAAGLAIAAMAQWIGNFVVSVTFPGLAAASLTLAYGLFTAFALLSIWFVAKKIKETKGIELENMASLENVASG